MSIYTHALYEQATCKRVVIDANKFTIIEIGGYMSEDNNYNSLVKCKGIDDFLRGRSEMVLLSEDKKSIFIELTKSGKYKLPGGGWDQDEDFMAAAIRETKEESHMIPTNVKYVEGMDYIEIYDNPKGWYQKKIPEEYQWIGVYTKVYCGIKEGMYKKRVNDMDQDDIAWKGKFYPINKVKSILLPVHKKAIELQLEV